MREDIESKNFKEFLSDDSDIEGTCQPRLCEILVDWKVKKVINKLNNNADMGPDGLSV